MTKVLKKYLLSYKEYLQTNITEDMTYRTHFVLLILLDIIAIGVILGFVSLLYGHIEKIGNWNKQQFLFFISFIILVGQIHMAFVSQNFWMFSDKIKQGTLDFILLKPIGTLFIIFFRHIRVGSIPGIFLAIALLIHHGQYVDLSLWDWLIMPFLVILSLVVRTSLEILLSMASFWMVESIGLNFLRMQSQDLARWPDFVYKYKTRIVLSYFIPILLTASAPVRFLFESRDYQLLIYTFIVVLVSWGLIYKVWKLGLKQYESASS